ncbi:MAG: type II toxin-antitoxin system RelE/ParE family toxin [Desulfovibrio sp.]|nr:type II toxin-antitoxin system RelE/ParE family toxin [Desulfovibrio sp.]MBS6831200.1 type II toxin-antitoxin system RelE/ParE family toxin [Desulfovibrio sp.]
MTVAETPAFTHEVKALLTEDERNDLILFLAEHPEAGDIIEQTGGVRKVRWARRGGGKSGGYRVIYYYYAESIPVFALMIYPKNRKDTLTMGEKNGLKRFVGELLKAYGVK